ncbi:hypothetical protein, partial [Pseudomonas sp. BF-R-01]|uniref:hypothetical protein n=1 Tax=Pseudomonas sp. BF-R-01 TaxID=2832365 RepID=UPI001CBAD292
IAMYQSTHLVTDPPLSPASRLLQGIGFAGGLLRRQKKTRQEPGQITVISLMRRYLRVRTKGFSNIDQSRDQL